MVDIYSKEKRSEIMSKIRSKNTRLEDDFRKTMFRSGLRGYRKYGKIKGKPDIVFPKQKLAVFLDGGFWHGWDFPKSLPKTRREFWREKIKGNIERDRKINRELKRLGWYVIRFWDHEIKKNPDKCIAKIKKTLKAIEKIRSAEIIAIDWFCGGGGMTRGFLNAGIGVIKGIDSDENAERTYEENNLGALFVWEDIREIKAEDVMNGIKLNKNQKLLFAACAPCQPFSQQNRSRYLDKDERKPLLTDFSRVVKEIKPDYVFMENVPGLTGHLGKDVYDEFKRTLLRLRYNFEERIINAKVYGVPQNRRRFVLVASKEGKIRIPKETHGKGRVPLKTVRDAIQKYPPIGAGKSSADVPNHVARGLNKLNLRRIRNTPKNGGGRKDWPKRLSLKCHLKRIGYEDVYGRMKWDSPSPTLTCKCTSLSNGRFGHPSQDRAISLREAASLQTFGDNYVFFGNLGDITRHVGNAVPVRLSEHFGRDFVKLNKITNKKH